MPHTNYVAIIPTYNSAEHLERCLQSIAGATPWLWDQGSTDGTLDIASRYNAIVRHWPWTWAEKSEYIMRMEATRTVLQQFPDCTHVLCLDSDEILTHNWRTEFDRLFAKHPEFEALSVPYWQLVGDARYGSVNNPIEYRIVCCRAGAGPLFDHDGTIRWHQCTAYVKGQCRLTHDTYLIHLGYVGDLRRRFKYNAARGDWPSVDAQALAAMIERPWASLEEVTPTPEWLVDKCLTLRAVIKEHEATRHITVAPGTKGAFKITDITYGTRPQPTSSDAV